MEIKRLEKLKKKTYDITNSEFPIGDFLNDILRNRDENYNKEKALEDFEKIIDVVLYLRNQNHTLESIKKILEEKND